MCVILISAIYLSHKKDENYDNNNNNYNNDVIDDNHVDIETPWGDAV